MEEIPTRKGPVILRSAQLSDRDNFRDLRLEALRDHPDAFGADYAKTLAEPPEFWEGRLRGSLGTDGMLYFAEVRDYLVAMTGIRLDTSPKNRHNSLIWGVYVRPEWRGLRLTDELIGRCLDWGKANGATIARLAVVTTNGPAIRCYLRCGFQIYGVDPWALRVDGIYQDELMMYRRLGVS